VLTASRRGHRPTEPSAHGPQAVHAASSQVGHRVRDAQEGARELSTLRSRSLTPQFPHNADTALVRLFVRSSSR
jgi:hypothetical protein